MNTSLATFEKDVIDASVLTPVLVDFWAEWCGPCKTLGPLLEKLEQEYAGRWRLVKVDVEENQQLAAHFQVRSIPHVVAFVDGRPVDQFTGVLPENQLRAFIERLVPNPAQAEHRTALHALEQGELAVARDHLQAALALDPGLDEARLDLIELLLEDEQVEDARREAELLSPKITQGIDPRYNVLKTRLDALDAATDLPPTDALEAAVAADPGNLEARFDLANALIARRAYEPALEHLLEIVKRDRSFRDDAGRKTMLSVFDLAAHRPELVSQWRRKLSAVLY
ncbi:thioredoxin [Trinickia dabaoshanensis]|uniref:Thioredoxin n=1 Tax=Trinickia dabaoshanensis TaxID=564714 RepID=A0A2N7VJS3_9BURK|nr:thioredoxin [Trinickia dabaoshanensis]PMS17388.1 thioredoxin [Trinickia dabaoshanensis]